MKMKFIRCQGGAARHENNFLSLSWRADIFSKFGAGGAKPSGRSGSTASDYYAGT